MKHKHEYHKPRPESTIKICIWCYQFKHIGGKPIIRAK